MATKHIPKVSVIITVYNESDTIGDLVLALKKQSLPPSEVIIVDGCSTDDTFTKLQLLSKSWTPLKIFQIKGNRSLGRNFGVSKSNSNLIAFTDAGCIPDPNWLLELTKPFSDSKNQIVSGYYLGLAQNDFQRSLIPYVLVMPDKAKLSEFYPSTRSMAMRKSAWEKSGGFDPKLNHNEDYAFAIWLKKQKFDFIFAPKAIVGWIPRKNIKDSAWMFTRFAIGDIQAGIIRPKVKILFLRYAIFVYLLLLTFQMPFMTIPLLILMLIYLIWAIIKNYRYVKRFSAIFWLPILQITSDLSVIFGTLVGFLAKANGLF